MIIGLLVVVAAGWAVISRGDKNTPGSDVNKPEMTQGLAQNSLAKSVSPPDGTIPQPPSEPQVQPIVTAQDQPANDQVSSILAQAAVLLKTEPQRMIEVRFQLNDALAKPMSRVQQLTVQDKLAELAQQWLFSPKIYEGDDLCEFYQVQPGDSLEVIGRKYKVPYEIIMRINGIPKPESLRAGVRIKVPKGPFNVKIYKSRFTLDLFLQKTYVKSYKVGLGEPGSETPTGLWVVRLGGKAVRPPWTDTETGRVFSGNEPDYPLGERWIPIRGVEGDAVGHSGFALHGTNEPETIGTLCSNGCIRLRNEDIIELYGLLYEEASQVLIVD